MKKYVVLKQIGSFKPDVAEWFDSKEDAKTYREIMQRNNPQFKYAVATIGDV